jgi:hypothetical protein
VAHTANDVRPIMTIHWEWLHHWSRVIGSKAPTHAHIDHKANMYSKPMAITTARTGVPCHTIQLVLLIFYVHNFISLIVILLIDTFSQKRVPRSSKMYFMRVTKYACLTSI